MTHRYRSSSFYPVLREVPEDFLDQIGIQTAPPGFVLVTFTSLDIQDYFEGLLGPSIEPNYALDVEGLKDKTRTKKARAFGGDV